MDVEIRKVKLFDWLHSINVSKTDLMIGDVAVMKQYDPFIINRGLAQSIDTLMTADKMNSMPDVPKDIHYKYCLAAVKSKKRYAKWPKKLQVNPNIHIVAEHYNVNHEVAEMYIGLMTDTQIEEVVERASGGGRRK